MDKYLPDANKSDWLNVYGYTIAQTLVATLKAAGNDLTRANVIKRATSLKDLRLPMLINGTAVNNSPERYTPMTRPATHPLRRDPMGRLRRPAAELITGR